MGAIRRWMGRSTALLGILLVGPAWCADDGTGPRSEPGGGRPAESGFYETATVRARPLGSATGSVTVMDRDEIEALGVATVGELIRFMTGMDLVSTGPRGGESFAQVRGGDPNFTMVLVDGVPLNDSTDQLGGSVNLNGLSTQQVERVEVVRGPVSSLYGSAGLGGVVHVITRRGSTDEKRIGARLATGSHGQRQGSVSLSRGGQTADYFVGATWEEEDDRVADDSFESLAVRGNFGRRLGPRTTLRVTGRAATWETRDFAKGSAGVLGTGETRSSDHDEASLRLELALGPAERAHTVYASVYRHELDRRSPFIPNADPMGFPIPPSEERTEYFTWTAGWNYPLRTGPRSTVTVGAETRLEDGENDSTLFQPPLFGGPIDGSYRLDRFIGATFVEYLAEFGWVLVEVGARVDVPEGFGTELSPRAGFAYRLPNGKTRVRASVARGFKLPSFFALGSPAVLGGNPDLEPEVSVGGDVGVEHSFASTGLTASLGVFRYEYRDLIDFLFPPEGFGLVNRSEVEAKGAELAVGWRPGRRFSADVDVTRQEVEDTETGDELVNRPDWLAGARFSWRVTPRLRWELDGQWVSESVDRELPVGEGTVSGYQLFGTALAVDVGREWTLDARIDNLADKDYDVLLGFPGPERAFRVGARYRPR